MARKFLDADIRQPPKCIDGRYRVYFVRGPDGGVKLVIETIAWIDGEPFVIEGDSIELRTLES